jgi:hypothetical protein
VKHDRPGDREERRRGERSGPAEPGARRGLEETDGRRAEQDLQDLGDGQRTSRKREDQAEEVHVQRGEEEGLAARGGPESHVARGHAPREIDVDAAVEASDRLKERVIVQLVRDDRAGDERDAKNEEDCAIQ